MRLAKANRYWGKVEENCSLNSIKEIEFSDIPGIGEGNLKFSSSINALCGKNGLGKSTLLKAIACTLNASCREFHSNILDRLSSSEFLVKTDIDGQVHSTSLEADRNSITAIYIDSSESCQRQLSALASEKNLDELIEQVEFGVLGSTDQNEVRRILGRNYSQVEVAELDSVIEGQTVPYFRVTRDSVTYESQNMALGELSILTIFWLINREDDGSVFLIEEPENFLTPQAQRYLLDYFAYACVKSRHWFLISSHSEHVVESIGLKNTYVLVENSPELPVIIRAPKHNFEYLQHLGLSPKKKGLILVEDTAAKVAINAACKYFGSFIQYDYEIVKLDGVPAITAVLKNFPRDSESFNVVGLFDGDERNRLKLPEELSYDFLPSDKSPEDALIDIVSNNVSETAMSLGIPKERLQEALSSVKGEESHDWLENLAKVLRLEYPECLDGLCRAWVNIEKRDFALILQKIDSSEEMYSQYVSEPIIPENYRSNGRVKFYRKDKGFGFILSDENEDLFFHVSELKGEISIAIGVDVEFEIKEEPDRKNNSAINVALKEGKG